MKTTVHGMGQLISVIPHQLGFVPRESIVLVMLQGKELGAVMRVDAVAPEPTDVAPYIHPLASAVWQTGATSCLLVAYDTPWTTETVHRLARGLRALGVDVSHTLRVQRGTWQATQCRRGCCPSLALPLLGTQDVPAALHMLTEGSNPYASREAAVAPLHTLDADGAAAVSTVLSRGQALSAQELTPDGTLPVFRDGVCMWRRFLKGREAAETPEHAAWLIETLNDPVWRDDVMCLLAPELLEVLGCSVRGYQGYPHDDELSAEEHLERLLQLLPVIPPEYRPRWLGCIALVRWRAGDGNGARLTVTEAMALLDGRDVAQIRLLSQLLSAGKTYEEMVAMLSGPVPSQHTR